MQIWGVAAYFNPAGYRSKRENYRLFRGRFPLPLLTLEVSTTGRFDLSPHDADHLVQLRSETALFQKENLFNLSLQHLPADCTHIVFTDTDLLWDQPRLAARGRPG